MQIDNFLKRPMEDNVHCHDGIGTVKEVSFFKDQDFETNIRFMNYLTLPPGTSIGIHEHKNDEELYIILEGRGMMTVDGEVSPVEAGDVIVNKPFGRHGLENNSEQEIRILVLEVYK